MTSCVNTAAACLGTTYALTASAPSVAVKSQSAANYATSKQYYQALSAPAGYVVSVTFSLIDTEAAYDFVYVFNNSLTATYRTSTIAAGASVYTCAGPTGT